MYLDRCAECGFDPADLRPAEMAIAIRSFGRRYRAPFTRALPGEDLDAVVRRSPGPGVWSALEYGGHVADLFRVFDDRVRCALEGREPDEPVVDWEARVAAASAALNPLSVADDIADAADNLATTLDEVSDHEWGLPGVHGKGATVTVEDLAAIAVHEGSHHLLDIGRVLRAARGR
ncbi:MAG TPA: DinB family protein [Acidimicrobiales bacterium]